MLCLNESLAFLRNNFKTEANMEIYMKKLYLFLTVVLTLTGFNSSYAYWNDGGTLHRATIGEWKRATYRNKLATAADVALISKMVERKVRASGSMETLKVYAKQLVICIDEAAAFSGNEHLKMSSLSAPCALTMGWLEEN